MRGLPLICLLGLNLAIPLSRALAEDPPQFILKWGATGSNPGQFSYPTGIAVDHSGNVYVADGGNDRVQVFTNTGAFLYSWGTTGSGEGQFDGPRSIDADPDGNVYVADYMNKRIQKFDSGGHFLTQWPGLPYGVYCVAVDPGGQYVYVTCGAVISKYDTSGNLLLTWGEPSNPNRDYHGIAIGPSGDVYVTEDFSPLVRKYTAFGLFVTRWDGSEGPGGRMVAPEGVAVDAQEHVYVTDASRCMVHKFTGDGTFLTKWGSQGTGDGQFRVPLDVATDNDGNIFVADTYNDRIQKFRWVPTATRASTWGQLKALYR